MGCFQICLRMFCSAKCTQTKPKVAHSVPYDHEAQIFLAVNQVLLTYVSFRSIYDSLLFAINFEDIFNL